MRKGLVGSYSKPPFRPSPGHPGEGSLALLSSAHVEPRFDSDSAAVTVDRLG